MYQSLLSIAARCGALSIAVLALLDPAPLRAQTDYYNLDRGRPLTVEDALVIEHHALEWQVAPFRLSGAHGQRTGMAFEPEIAWGILPRTQLELGVPLTWQGVGQRRLGAAGVHLAVLHALNAETLSLPGLAVTASAIAPAGPFGPARTFASFGAIATRTTSAGRLHLNVEATLGAAGDRTPDEATRWRAGLAVDRSFPVQALLVGAELTAEEPLGGGGTQWRAGIGTRVQVGPRTALDAGLGRDLGGAGTWFVTMGSAVSFGLVRWPGGGR